MGDPSYLRYVPPSVANIPIDWSRVPKESREHMLLWAYDWKKKVDRPLPATIGDLAKWFDRSKFFGYLRPELCTPIMDISEFGLKSAPDGRIQAGPRIYMKYLEQVWFLLFSPGTRDCVTGYSHDIIVKDEDEDEDIENGEDTDDGETNEDMQVEADESQEKNEKDDKGVKKDMENEPDEDEDEEDEEDGDYEPEQRGAAEETALAEQFDVTLEQEVGRGMAVFVKITKKLAGWSASTLEDNLVLAQYADAIMTLPMSHPAYTGLMSSIFRKY